MENIYFKKVEEILDLFPVECRKNYYENKKTLKIKVEKSNGEREGFYDVYKNEITLYNIDVLPHELFHMAFNNKDKLDKKIYKDLNVYFSNGIECIMEKDGNECLYGGALNEGFVEYLSRKCSSLRGYVYYYYFADLLISIHGEDILKYAFCNNFKSFINDKRFFDIGSLYKELENLSRKIKFQKNLIDLFDGTQEIIKNEEEVLKEFYVNEYLLRKSIFNLFKIIIDEYKNCCKPILLKEEFINKLFNFLIDSDYECVFICDNNIFNLKDELCLLIDEFNCKKLAKRPIQN